MKRFAALIDGLVFMPSRNGKIRLLADYLAHAPDPDRGWALAALTGGLVFTEAKSSAIRKLTEARVDPVLFNWSYDFVGDLAETVALIWPQRRGGIGDNLPEPSLTDVVSGLHAAKRGEVPRLLEGWLDRMEASVVTRC